MKQELRFWTTRLFTLAVSLIALGLFASAVEAKKIYKWVDENGKTHFGDQAPGVEAQEIRIPKTSTVNTDAVDDRHTRTQRLLDSLEQERNEKNEAKALAAEESQKRKAYCKEARDQQYKYQHSSFLYTTDDDGNRKILGDEEHEKAMAKAQADVDRWCD